MASNRNTIITLFVLTADSIVYFLLLVIIWPLSIYHPHKVHAQFPNDNRIGLTKPDSLSTFLPAKEAIQSLIFLLDTKLEVDKEGLEPSTFRLWANCSDQLSYMSIYFKRNEFGLLFKNFLGFLIAGLFCAVYSLVDPHGFKTYHLRRFEIYNLAKLLERAAHCSPIHFLAFVEWPK